MSAPFQPRRVPDRPESDASAETPDVPPAQPVVDPEDDVWLAQWERDLEERDQAFLDPFAEEEWR